MNEQEMQVYMVKENRRAQLVAMLHGYTPYKDGDTEQSLKDEYLELMGEAYRSPLEEAADSVEKAKAARALRIKNQLVADQKIVDDAKSNGFMDCIDIRNGLGFSENISGSAAYNWIINSNEEVIYLIPDGITQIRKFRRTGVYADVFQRVLAFKEQQYADWRAEQAERNAEAEAEAIRLIKEQQVALDAQKAEYDAYRAARLAEVEERNRQRAEEHAAKQAEIDALVNPPDRTPEERAALILRGINDYAGPTNLRGRPKMKPFRAHLTVVHGMGDSWSVTFRERNKVWPLRDQ